MYMGALRQLAAVGKGGLDDSIRGKVVNEGGEGIAVGQGEFGTIEKGIKAGGARGTGRSGALPARDHRPPGAGNCDHSPPLLAS